MSAREFLCACLAMCCAFSLYPGALPYPSIDNFRTDLESFDTFGTRRVSGSMTDYMDAQGAIELTNSESDYAILGPGFFKVRSRVDGSAYYTRRGRFAIRDDAFYTESGDEVIVSADDFLRMRDAGASTASITLYYPDNGQEIRIVDNARWVSGPDCATDCRTLSGTVVFRALEQNPVDVSALLNALQDMLRDALTANRADIDRDASENCLALVVSVRHDIEAADRRYGLDAATSSRVRQLASELAMLTEYDSHR